MVKSKTRRDSEILVRNPSPRLFGEKFRDSKKVKANHEKNETLRLIKNASEISRSCQNFPRPTVSEEPFITPHMATLKRVKFGASTASWKNRPGSTISKTNNWLRELIALYQYI